MGCDQDAGKGLSCSPPPVAKSRTQRRGTSAPLANAWIASGGLAMGVRAGEEYLDVGTLQGYRAAIRLLQQASDDDSSRFRSDKKGSSDGQRLNSNAK